METQGENQSRVATYRLEILNAALQGSGIVNFVATPQR